MLTIRQEQLDDLQKGSLRNFKDRMIEHIAKFFPKQLTALGETKARDLVQYGIEHAAQFGIETERDVCLYIDLMVVFGRDLETSDKLPCASRILHDKYTDFPAHKIDVLYDAALAQLREQINRERIGG